jgi:hypothetical protein
VIACLIMARAVWADKTQDALSRLTTGENLTRENPLLHLRNWLMGEGSREDNSLVRQVMFHHLAAFVDGKSLPQVVVNSNQAFIRISKLHKVRFEKICAFYGKQLPAALGDSKESAEPDPNAGPLSAEAIRIGKSFSGSFSSTDLRARTDANVGTWLGIWLNRGWIEGCGGNSFVCTNKFGKL